LVRAKPGIFLGVLIWSEKSKAKIVTDGISFPEETLTPKRLFQALSISLLLMINLMLSFAPAHAATVYSSEPDFVNFVDSVKNGHAGVVRGVYAQGVLALPVVQQPDKEPAYVSTAQGVATEFQSAKTQGNIGLLAHNYLAGKNFPSLAIGQEVRAVFGDGKIEYYRITRVMRFKTLQPTSTTSDFINLDDGKLYTATQVFSLVYKGARHVTFQTCIANNGNASWGRLFIIAEPLING
jgi:hypothetical protein